MNYKKLIEVAMPIKEISAESVSVINPFDMVIFQVCINGGQEDLCPFAVQLYLPA